MYLQCIDLSAVKREGYWDEAALLCYRRETGRRLAECGISIEVKPGNGKKDGTKDAAERKLALCQQEARRIGSGLYRKMFAASGYNARAKAKLPIRQMGGMIDGHGMLQLTRLQIQADPESGRITGMAAGDGGYWFDGNMDPDGPFLGEYARTVIEAYGERGIDCPDVHQFRMYIDFHNICYIRTHFKGSSDFQKLKAYARKTGRRLDFVSSSRLHNRKLKKDLGRRKRQTNDKVKSSSGLSEFIIRMCPDEYGPAGQFVTQWDYLRAIRQTGRIDSDPSGYTVKEYKPIVETESFNYCKNDRVKVGGRRGLHTLLDVKPANGKTGYENDLKKEGKKYWVADKAYKEEFTGKDILRGNLLMPFWLKK